MVSNHTSYIDILVLMALFMPSFVAKDAIKKTPFIGRISRIINCVYVDRSSINNTTNKIIERQKQTRDNFPPIIIFPEGTTTNGNYLITFKKGAFIAGLPVKPVVIRYPHKYFNPAYETIPGGHHFFYSLTQIVNYVSVTELPVYIPNEQEKMDSNLYAENVRKEMASILNIPCVDVSYDNKLEYHNRIKKGEFSWDLTFTQITKSQ